MAPERPFFPSCLLVVDSADRSTLDVISDIYGNMMQLKRTMYFSKKC